MTILLYYDQYYSGGNVIKILKAFITLVVFEANWYLINLPLDMHFGMKYSEIIAIELHSSTRTHKV